MCYGAVEQASPPSHTTDHDEAPSGKSSSINLSQSVHPFVRQSFHLVCGVGGGVRVSATLELQATEEGTHININTATAKPLDWANKL